jgi:hypothetical protein
MTYLHRFQKYGPAIVESDVGDEVHVLKSDPNAFLSMPTIAKLCKIYLTFTLDPL